MWHDIICEKGEMFQWVDPWVQRVKKQAYRIESYLQVWSQVEFVCYILTLFWVAVSMTVFCACATVIVWKKINCFWLTRFMDREEFWSRTNHIESHPNLMHMLENLRFEISELWWFRWEFEFELMWSYLLEVLGCVLPVRCMWIVSGWERRLTNGYQTTRFRSLKHVTVESYSKRDVADPWSPWLGRLSRLDPYVICVFIS